MLDEARKGRFDFVQIGLALAHGGLLTKQARVDPHGPLEVCDHGFYFGFFCLIHGLGRCDSRLRSNQRQRIGEHGFCGAGAEDEAFEQ